MGDIARNQYFMTTKDFKMLLEANDGLSVFIDHPEYIVHLSMILKDCAYCRKVSSDNPLKPCVRGCYLEKMGFDMGSSSAPNSTILLSRICEMFCTILRYDTQIESVKKENEQKEIDISARLKELEDTAKKIREEQQGLEKDKGDIAAFKAKKEKLGRPSKFDGRRLLYEVHYFGVENKPSIEELTKIVGAKRSTVCEDIRRIKKEKGLI